MSRWAPMTPEESRAARLRSYREYRERNKEKIRARAALYRERNRERRNAYGRNRYKELGGRKMKCPEKLRETDRRHHLKKNFGLTVEQYEQMERRQHGMCAICATRNPGQRLAVDHCHDTGAVRGLLCLRCNVGIGMLNDDPKLLAEAILYLEAYADGR